MFGKRPYQGVCRKEYKEKIMSTVVQIKSEEKPENWTEECCDLINKLLQRKEEMRLGHKGAQSLKEHPWFSDVKWDDLLAHKVTPPFTPPNVYFYKI
jgi:hypothetical protein